MKYYGIRGVALKWMESYLNERMQYVSYNEVCSSSSMVLTGVPQGSVLGPLLYLIYVNDLANISQSLLPISFADDTNVFLSGKNINNIIDKMNNDLKHFYTWTTVNRLTLNIDKTHYRIFSTRKKSRNQYKGLY